VLQNIKDALERDLTLLRHEDLDSARTKLTSKVERLCRLWHLSNEEKTNLLAHVEILLAKTFIR
jgi:hypothetical protein